MIAKFLQLSTVELRCDEMPRDWGNWLFRYIENLDLTNLRKNNQNVRYIEGWLIVVVLCVFFFLCGATPHYPAFCDRNHCCK